MYWSCWSMLKDTERFIELTLASVAIWFLVANYALRIIQSNTSKGIIIYFLNGSAIDERKQ